MYNLMIVAAFYVLGAAVEPQVLSGGHTYEHCRVLEKHANLYMDKNPEETHKAIAYCQKAN